jgi:hypothetical protein
MQKTKYTKRIIMYNTHVNISAMIKLRLVSFNEGVEKIIDRKEGISKIKKQRIFYFSTNAHSMKSILILLALCCSIQALAQQIEAGANAGGAFSSIPGFGPYFNVKGLIDLKKIQIGLGADYIGFIENNDLIYTTGNSSELVKNNATTHHLVPQVIFNVKWNRPKSILYIGVNGGYMNRMARTYTLRRDLQNEIVIDQSPFKTYQGFSIGGQLGVTANTKRRLRLNAEVSPRYGYTKQSGGFFYMPICAGVRYIAAEKVCVDALFYRIF